MLALDPPRPSDPEHWSNGGDAITNFKPHAQPLYEAAIALHPECGLCISDEPIAKVAGHKSLRFSTKKLANLSDFYKTFWKLKETQFADIEL